MQRIDVGSDVAMIGMWDKAFLTEEWARSVKCDTDEQIEREAEKGKIFAIQMGGDGVDTIQVYVNEMIPESDKTGYKAIEKTYLIKTISGQLTLGGIEGYGRDVPAITGEDSIVVLPVGDYELRLFEHIYDEEDEYDPSVIAKKQLTELVGENDVKLWQRVNQFKFILPVAMFVVMGLLSISLLVSLGMTVLLTWLSYALFFKSLIGKNFKKLDARFEALLVEAIEQSPPWFLFELTKLDGEHDLEGGIFDVT